MCTNPTRNDNRDTRGMSRRAAAIPAGLQSLSLPTPQLQGPARQVGWESNTTPGLPPETAPAPDLISAGVGATIAQHRMLMKGFRLRYVLASSPRRAGNREWETSLDVLPCVQESRTRGGTADKRPVRLEFDEQYPASGVSGLRDSLADEVGR